MHKEDTKHKRSITEMKHCIWTCVRRMNTSKVTAVKICLSSKSTCLYASHDLDIKYSTEKQPTKTIECLP